MLNGLRNSLEEIRAKQKLIDSSWDESMEIDLLAFYTRVITSMSDAERCSIFIHNPEKETLWLQVGAGVESHQIEVPVKGSMVGSVISSAKPLFENDLENKDGAHKLVDAETGFVTRNALCVPIKRMGSTEVIGVIQILNKDNNAAFDDQDLKLLEEVAGYMALSIENIFFGQKTLDVTESIFRIAKKLLFGLLGTVVVLLLLIFAYFIGLMAFI